MAKDYSKVQVKRKGFFGRLFKMLLSFYPVMLPCMLVLLVFNAIVRSLPSVFMQRVIALIEDSGTSTWSDISSQVISLVAILATFYILSLIADVVYTQLMAVITQGTLAKLREKMVANM